MDFNPRLREGGDCADQEEKEGERISIHASVKEATFFLGRNGSFRTDFNPRLREGGDDPTIKKESSKYISIHASVKEATSFLQEHGHLSKFQSTPP